jgi:uncharacterized phage-associated protein
MVSLLTIYMAVLQFMQRGAGVANITFQFDRDKAIETILYLANRVADSDIYGICKLLYLVDKTSLEKYGRFIFGETYYAMKEGSTPSNVYDLLKEASQTPTDELRVDGNQVIALRDANLDYLSESDVECLDQIINVWGKVPNWSRRVAAHDDAWKQAWDKRGDKGSVKIPVESIAELLADSDNLINYLSHADTG